MSGKSELALFDANLPQVCVESGRFVEICPTTSLSENSNSIEFHIRASETEYLDLNDTFLYLQLKVTAADGKNLASTSTATPSNFFMNSLFSDVTLSLNDIVVEGGQHLYPYKATFEDLFNFDKGSKEEQLYLMGNDDDKDRRKNWIAGSALCELTGALRLDFFNQPKYLLPGVGAKILLQRSKDKFAILNPGGNPRIKILAAKLTVRRVKVDDGVIIGHNKALREKNATYSYDRKQVVSYSIGQGSLSHYKDGLFSRSLLPKFVIVGFVGTDGFNGIGTGDCFSFQPFDVCSVGLYRDGQSVPYSRLYEPKFPEACVEAYFKSIVHCPQHFNKNRSSAIPFNLYKNGGYTFFTFNLTPDFDFHVPQLPRDSNLCLEVKFRTPLAQSINVIVYGVFDYELQITKDRKIITGNVH